MTNGIFYLFSGFWLGALHAATPGHGKTKVLKSFGLVDPGNQCPNLK